MKRKITEVSVFEFFLCMFVILIHLLSEGVDTFPKWSFSSVLFSSLTRITTFAVPAFIFTSSLKLFYKYGDKRKFSYFRFVKDRFIKILCPYLFWALIYYIVYVFVLNIYKYDLEEMFGLIISGNLSAQFYFVILIIQFYLIMPIWLSISKFKSKIFTGILIALTFVITVLFRMYYPYTLAIHKVFPSYLIFWVLGMYVGLNYDTFIKFISHHKPVIYVGWLILAISHCVLSYIQYGGLITYTFSPLIVVIFCFFSIFGFYSYARELTLSLESRGKGLLTSISQASYDIYLIHCLIIVTLGKILTDLDIENIWQRFLIIGFATYLISIIFSVLQATIYANFKSRRLRSSTARARKMARRKRYL